MTKDINFTTINKKNKDKYFDQILTFYNRYFPEKSNRLIIKYSPVLFIAIERNIIVGACRLLTDFSRNATLYDLIVRKNHRKQGLGSKLTEMAVEFCKKKNIKKLYLATDPRRTWLKNFYLKRGFSVISDQTLMKIEP